MNHPCDALLTRAKAGTLPIRAVGGNVLLRRLYMDGPSLILAGGTSTSDGRVGQVAEVVGMGGRWTQGKPWSPPMPEQDKRRNGMMDDGSLDPDWKPMWRYPDSSTPRRPEPTFTRMHEHFLSSLSVGDLVVYNQSRVYDTFMFEGFELLVYPGNWILGKLEDGHLVERPEMRRYERGATV